MTDGISQSDIDWACRQIACYGELYPRYLTYATVLKKVLEQAVRGLAPLATIETRPKNIASFAEKIMRKRDKYRDPVNQLTDLCGARVITHTYAEIGLICEFIEQHFIVDVANSVKIHQRLRPNEFGYRSVHYVVQIPRGVFTKEREAIEIPEDVYPGPQGSPPMKAEIQVRTLLEHAWAVFSHEKAYKGAFSMPAVWERDLNGIAALLEEADQAFSNIQAGLRAYAASYGASMKPEQIRNEIALLRVVWGCSNSDLDVAYRIAKLAITVEDWDLAIDMLRPHKESLNQPMLRDLGISLTKKHAQEPQGTDFMEGRELLARACELNPADADAWASRAGAHRNDPATRRFYYQRAFVADPTDPYAVSRLLVSELSRAWEPAATQLSDLAPNQPIERQYLPAVQLTEPAIRASIQRCRSQIAAGTNMPWAYFSLGMFHLMLHEPYESLIAYAKATQLSTAPWMIKTSLDTLQELAPVRSLLPGYDWLVRWLILGWATLFPDKAPVDQMAALRRSSEEPISAPVLVIAGGTDASVKEKMQTYRKLLLDGLGDHAGTIISGGTLAGIARLVGDVQEVAGDKIRTIGYVPAEAEDLALDPRYRELRTTDGRDFSALKVVQYWIDLLLSGIRPQQVKLIGINGGRISAVEYRLALALGAQVVVIEGSGRAVEDLLNDRDWAGEPNLHPMPADTTALACFAGVGQPIEASQRESLGRAIHEAYCQVQAAERAKSDPSTVDWDSLAENLRESNRQQADHIKKKLARIGCSICAAGATEQPVMEFSREEVETMAEMEHGRWIAERLQEGWRRGTPKDVQKKISPYLASWKDLSEEVKEWDRATVHRIPEFLAQVGLHIHRKSVLDGGSWPPTR